jgi:hypothetical protein
MFASGDQCSIAFTPPYLGFPPDVLDGFGLFFQAQLQVATDLGWVAIGPRSFDEAPTGRRSEAGSAVVTPSQARGSKKRMR